METFDGNRADFCPKTSFPTGFDGLCPEFTPLLNEFDLTPQTKVGSLVQIGRHADPAQKSDNHSEGYQKDSVHV